MDNPAQMKILSAVWRSPGLCRSELGGRVGLHANTVTRRVDALLREGFLREGAAAPPGRRGRPKIPLEVDPARVCVGGIAIGAGGVGAVAMNLLGQPLGGFARAAAAGPAGIAKAVGRLLQGLLLQKPVALGVSVTGFVDPVGRRILFSSASPAAEVDLAPLLRRAGTTPVAVNSEVHALSARWLMGHAKSENEDTLIVTLEDGAVGASLLIEGRPNRGCVLGGNELGHMGLNVETAPCYCGASGCVERVFSTDYLHRLGGAGSLADALSAPDLPEAARRIVALTARGLANATVFARPHRMVVAGTPARHARFRAELERAWREFLPAVFRDRIALEWYATQGTISAETAGWLAIATILHGGGD